MDEEALLRTIAAQANQLRLAGDLVGAKMAEIAALKKRIAELEAQEKTPDPA